MRGPPRRPHWSAPWKVPGPGWGLGRRMKEQRWAPPAEETEYEYSGSEEEDDSHGEEGEPRWATAPAQGQPCSQPWGPLVCGGGGGVEPRRRGSRAPCRGGRRPAVGGGGG